MVQMVKNLPAMQEIQIQSLDGEDPLEKGMATHSSTLAWRIPCTEEPRGLQSMGSQRIPQDRATNTFTVFTTSATWGPCLAHAAAAAAKSLQSCPTLYDPIDGSPPGSPIPGILQARTLEWVAISFSNA